MPHRQGRPGNRAKNYRKIMRLREREPYLNQREIAYRLGLSRSYVAGIIADPTGHDDRVRKDGYRRPCANGCGALLTGSDGPDGKDNSTGYCKDCVGPMRKHWTAEVVVECIREWARRRGRAPGAQEWIAKHIDPDGYVFPPRTSVYVAAHDSSSPFETWADAIQAAGFPRPLSDRNYDKDNRWGVENMAEPKLTRDYVVFSVTENGDAEHYEFVGVYEASTTKECLEKNVKTHGKFRIAAVGALVEYDLEARPVATRTAPRI